jgi:hypothetical protein
MYTVDQRGISVQEGGETKSSELESKTRSQSYPPSWSNFKKYAKLSDLCYEESDAVPQPHLLSFGVLHPHIIMSYNPEKDVADGSGSHTSLSDLEVCPLTGDEERFPLKQQRKCKPRWLADKNVFWKLWSIAMTVTTPILLIISVHRGPSHKASSRPSSTIPSEAAYNSGDAIVETWKKEHLVETKFYRDLRYMTLSHDSDWLWKEHTDMLSGNIILPAAEDGSTTVLTLH